VTVQGLARLVFLYWRRMNPIPNVIWRRFERLRQRHPVQYGDLRGGLASALVSLPYTLTVGWLTLGALGPRFAVLGMFAGILSTVVAGLVASRITGTPCQINGPRASVALVTGSMVAALAAHPALQTPGGPNALRLLGILSLCLALAGALQILLGTLNFGTWVKFIPYPVVSGFMVAVGILVALPQVPILLGHPGAGWLQAIQDIEPGALLTGLATIGTMSLVNWRLGQVPAPIIGVLSGSAFYYLVLPWLQWPGGATALGQASASDLLLPWTARQWDGPAQTLGLVLFSLPAIVTLALVGSVESLLSSTVIDIVGNTRHDSNRELVCQGLCNVSVAAAGGVASAGAPFRGVANYNAGGRTAAAAAWHALIMLALALAAMPLIVRVPLSVWAGVLVMVGYAIFDAWRRRLQACAPPDIAVGLVVAIVALASGSVPATLAGFVAAMILYVRNTSRTIVRSVADGSVRRSPRVRPHRHVEHLALHGTAIRIVELQGSLFFGTASRCASAVEDESAVARWLILDLHRVAEIDATGAQVLQQLLRRLAAGGVRVMLASVAPGGRRGTVLLAAGVAPEGGWFADTDTALEQAEQQLLRQVFPDIDDEGELPLSSMELCQGMSPEQLEILERYMVRELYPRGTVLFLEGEPGAAMYLICRGAVSVNIGLAQGRRRWLGTYAAGVVVGEMAVLEGKHRSADATCDAETVLRILTADRLGCLRDEQPVVHGMIMSNLARQLAARLRSRTEEVRLLLG
jgi:SulP family sulfate permease